MIDDPLNERPLEVFARRLEPWGRSIEIHFYRRAKEPGMVECLTRTWESVPEMHRPPEGLFLEFKTAQSLMDQLWNCGFRPTEGAGSAGALLATQEHVKDLRMVTDHLLRIIENTPPVIHIQDQKVRPL